MIDLKSILGNYNLDMDGIYSRQIKNITQKEEIKFRNSVAKKNYDNFLEEISKHHSIPVMDREVEVFIRKIPKNGKIIDIGGSWGWHWRHIKEQRPDIKVFIVDFIRNNLLFALKILEDQIGENIFLIEDDATSLQLPDKIFNGLWTVQTFQHIPDFEKAILEGYRVLNDNGIFINYSFNNQIIVRILYKIFKKKYPVNEYLDGQFFLSRSSLEQKNIIEIIFKNKVEVRYSEIIFSPEIKFLLAGKEASLLGLIDSYLSSSFKLLKLIARQESFSIKKEI